MPRYFFDCFEGGKFLNDAYGMDLNDAAEAASQAEELVKGLIGESTIASGASGIVVQVRASDGMVVHTVQGSIVSRSTAPSSST